MVGVGFVCNVECEGSPEVGLMEESCGSLDVDGSVAEGVVLVVVEELVAEELVVVGLTEESCSSSDVDVSRAAVIVVGDWSVPIEVGSIEEATGSSDVDVSGPVVKAGVGFDCSVESETPIEVSSTVESCGSSDVSGAVVIIVEDWSVCKVESDDPIEVGSTEEPSGSSDVDISGAAVIVAGD